MRQGDGTDLDPNNVNAEMAAQRKRTPHEGRKPIEFGAELPTTCSRCGSRGHLAKECWAEGDKKYEMVPESVVRELQLSQR